MSEPPRSSAHAPAADLRRGRSARRGLPAAHLAITSRSCSATAAAASSRRNSSSASSCPPSPIRCLTNWTIRPCSSSTARAWRSPPTPLSSRPIFFPGGDIGHLAVNGTVNDLAMSGARPLYLAAAFILEEGLPTEDLRRVVAVHGRRRPGSRRATRRRRHQGRQPRQGRQDFHHHHRHRRDRAPGRTSPPTRARPGDQIILSGYIGDHGMAIMSQRENLEFEGVIESDSRAAALAGRRHARSAPARHPLPARCHARRRRHGAERNRRALADRACYLRGNRNPGSRHRQRRMRNPGTRSALRRQRRQAGRHRRPRKLPNRCSRACVNTRFGRDARIIGQVVSDHPGMVLMRTEIGGTRILDTLFGEQLPRIC